MMFQIVRSNTATAGSLNTMQSQLAKGLTISANLFYNYSFKNII